MIAKTLTRVTNSSLKSIRYPLTSKASLYPLVSFKGMSTTGPTDSGRRSPGAGQPLDPRDASQARGHVNYIKGLAEEVVGKVTGAESWKQCGQEDKARAVHEMRLAKEEGDKQANYDKRSPAVLTVEGAGEKVAGYMTGCAGMKERGGEKQHAAKAKTP